MPPLFAHLQALFSPNGLPSDTTARRALRRTVLYGGLIIVLALILWVIMPVPEAGSPTSSEPASPTFSLLSPNLVLVYLILGGGALLALYVRRKQLPVRSQGEHIRVLESHTLSTTHHLQLVQCEGEKLLLGITPGEIRLLRTYPASSFEDVLEHELSDHTPSNPPAV